MPHRKAVAHVEGKLGTLIGFIPLAVVIYWGAAFSTTALGSPFWTTVAVLVSYSALLVWVWAVWRLLHVAAWKRDQIIAEELAEQTIGFTYRDDPDATEPMLLTHEFQPVSGDLEFAREMSREIDKHRGAPTVVAAVRRRTNTYFEQLANAKPPVMPPGFIEGCSPDEWVWGGAHHRTEVLPVRSFFPDTEPEMPRADG